MTAQPNAGWINRRARRDAATPKECAICKAYIGSPQGFWWHVRRIHDLKVSDYYEKYDQNPCRQCGKQIPFYKSRPQTFARIFCSNWCSGHSRKGTGHYLWKGGSLTGEGYLKVSIYKFPEKLWPILEPMKTMVHHRNYILEHRAIMAIKLGRTLQKWETVHHLNGKKLDNRPENLELRIGSHGVGATTCPHCGKSYA